jgi:uncharacterized protein YlxP (DUF503 family)
MLPHAEDFIVGSDGLTRLCLESGGPGLALKNRARLFVFAGMKMPIGLLTLEIYIPEAHSLKDKRQVLRSLKDRLRGKFNVAVAELEGQDSWQRSVVGIVSLANNAGFLEQSLRTVLEDSERHLGRDLVGHELEVL